MVENFEGGNAGSSRVEQSNLSGADLLAEGQAMSFQSGASQPADAHSGNSEGVNTQSSSELVFDDGIYGAQGTGGAREGNQGGDGQARENSSENRNADQRKPSDSEKPPMYEYRGRQYDRRVSGPRVPGGLDL